ncbi:hypothetical protein [uncultured Ferrimonas sp.]|nr:hypothetical protein [uncultured Ferrimonas sp.]
MQEQQQAEHASEQDSSWRDGTVGHQLVDLLEQNYSASEEE